MSTLSTPMLTVDRFHYNKETNNFTAEASDFRGEEYLGRVYDDACDVGFTLYNPKTDRSVRFAQCSTDIVNDEIVGEWFEPIEWMIDAKWTRKMPEHIASIRVLIIND